MGIAKVFFEKFPLEILPSIPLRAAELREFSLGIPQEVLLEIRSRSFFGFFFRKVPLGSFLQEFL